MTDLSQTELENIEAACRAGWNWRRSKWTTPEWDRLPLNTRIAVAAKFRVALAELSRRQKDESK